MKIPKTIICYLAIAVVFFACDDQGTNNLVQVQKQHQDPFVEHSKLEDIQNIYDSSYNKSLLELTERFVPYVRERIKILNSEFQNNTDILQLEPLFEKAPPKSEISTSFQATVSEFKSCLQDYPVVMELFKHPIYRGMEINQNTLISCAPIYNDSLYTDIVAFNLNEKRQP